MSRHTFSFLRKARRLRTREPRRQLRFETLEPRQMLAAANLLVTELMATNVGLVPDGDGNYGDWIEVFNADSVAVNLGNYYLTDNDTNLEKWQFPSITLNPGAYRVVFASAPLDSQGEVLSNYVDGQGKFHTNFKLDAEGEDLVLAYKDPATQLVSVVHEYAGGFPDQFPNVSYGIASDSMLHYFDAPTPGGPNGAGLLGAVEDTKFSVDRGFYDDPFQLTITTDTSAAAIYYTTDGSAPTPSTGTFYSAPLTIDHTTVVRAIATKSNYLSTNIDTQTYLFLNDIVRQTQQTALDAGYPAVWNADNGSYTADYGFDPDVVGTFDANGNPLGDDLFGGIYASQLKDNLLAIPTISIVLDPEDMFGDGGPFTPEGIYIDPRQGVNLQPERPTSIEWITQDGSAELQVDAGIQMQGGAFRSQFFTRKHSFRLVFKDEYGPSELTFPLFDDSAVSTFNTVVLKATANDGYSWRSAQPSDGPSTLQYARDQFGHSLQQDMGYASPHDAYAHLYINGMYWGLYYAQERPDAEFAESYLGINPDNWDGIHDDDAETGDFVAWNATLVKTTQAGSSLQAYMELQGLNLDGTLDPSTPPLLDVQNYIDYLIVNVWGGNDDWPHNNFWAGRDRSPDTTEGFQFFLWDFDGVMHVNEKWSPLNTKTFNQGFVGEGGENNVGEFHHNLQTNPEYQLAFADQVHKWFFNEGILTPDSLIARYQEIADLVEQVMVAESARWGDMNSPTPTPLVLSDWAAERDYLLNTYLPQRSSIVMQEMREYGFYPDTDAPSFNQFGGYVPSGFGLSMSAPAGTIYYTLDGSDPRLVGGAVNNGSAMIYSGEPIEINGDVTVRARALNGGEWSALNEADFTTTAPGDFTKLRITELQYHPANFPGVVDDEDPEYIEILNTDSLPVSLNGIAIAGFASNPYLFDDGQILVPGERIVVARNPTVFQSIYGNDIHLAPSGYGDRSLDNGGESVILVGPQGQVLQGFTYGDSSPWPSAADGSGRSLEIIDPLGNPGAPNNWRASLYPIGSPGVEGLPIPGDYDESGAVDAADYGQWKQAFGSAAVQAGFGADGNRDGRIDAADYTVWRNHLGSSTTLYGNAGFGSLAGESTIAVPLETAAFDDMVDGPSAGDATDTAAINLAAFMHDRSPSARTGAIENTAGRSPSSAISSFRRPANDLLLALIDLEDVQSKHANVPIDNPAKPEDATTEPCLAALDRVFELLS